MPIEANSLILTCGPFYGLPTAIDLSDWDGTPIEVTLRDRCGASSEMLQEMKLTSCTACHAFPGLVE